MNQSWAFKHEPKTLNEMVLSDEKRIMMENIIRDLPNTLIYGKQGTGKSTFTNILATYHEKQYLEINASIDNGIDTIRSTVTKFAQASSFDLVSKKIVHFEEADKLTEGAQKALKCLIDNTQKWNSFFFTCNDISKIIDPIKSRCTYELHLEDTDKKKIYDHVLKILRYENVTIQNNDDLNHVIDYYYPDIRKVLSYMESHSNNNIFKIGTDLKL